MKICLDASAMAVVIGMDCWVGYVLYYLGINMSSSKIEFLIGHFFLLTLNIKFKQETAYQVHIFCLNCGIF